MIQGLAAGLTLAACSGTEEPPGSNPDARPPSPDARPPTITPEMITEGTQYPLGVAAGDLVADRALLWTRYSGTAPLAVIAWRMDGASYVEQIGPIDATPADGGFTHVAVHGLVAGARYRYAFVELGDAGPQLRSRVGKFRAPLADDASEVLTFGAICCTEQTRSPGPIAKASLREDLDAFLYVGDNAYCDGATTVPTFREKYASHFGRPEHLALRAQSGAYATWDDHELENDTNPEEMDPAHLEAAFQTFFEHWPIAPIEGQRRVWRSSRWGKTVEVFCLDCRSERKPSTRTSDNPIYISPAQLAWLKAGLMASQATFKLIMNSVPITDMPTVWDAQPQDRWEGYAAQRTDILSYIDTNQIKGVLWVGGDFHLAYISHVAKTGVGSTQREVLVGPGGQSANALVWSLGAPQFSFKSGTNNYTTLKLDPTAKAVTVSYFDGDGEMFHSETFVP